MRIADDKIRYVEARFLEQYPAGLDDEKWIELWKKHSKSRLFEAFQTDLSEPNLKLAIESGVLENLAERVVKLVKQATTISVFEKIAFQNFMSYREIHPRFFMALYDFLYHFDDESFEEMIDVLSVFKMEKNAFPAKWPLISFFKAYQSPYNYSFVKPTTTKKVAALLQWEIDYNSRPNYQTYMKIVTMVKQFQKQSVYCQNLDLMRVQGMLFIGVK